MDLVEGISTIGSSPMTARERAHVLIDEFSDAELEEIGGLLRAHREKVEPEMAELPEAWKTLEDGTPPLTGSQPSTRPGAISDAGLRSRSRRDRRGSGRS